VAAGQRHVEALAGGGRQREAQRVAAEQVHALGVRREVQPVHQHLPQRRLPQRGALDLDDLRRAHDVHEAAAAGHLDARPG
jgi:hypothetical protein